MFFLLFLLLALGMHRLVPIPLLIGAILVLYWLPKFVFVRALEHFFPEVVTRARFPMHSPVLALTFDDVPRESLVRIIALLDRYNMKGTFFVISGSVARQNVKLLVDAVRNGHQLGNHGRTDSVHMFKKNNNLVREIKDCDRLIRAIYKEAGVAVPHRMFYRPGSGIFDGTMLKLSRTLGYVLALGSVYPNDPLVRSSAINYYYLIGHIEPGDVVVLHDRKWTPALLERLLPWMKSRGLRSVAMDKLPGL